MASNKAQIDVYVNGTIYFFCTFFNSHISNPLSSKAVGDMKKWTKQVVYTERKLDNL